MLAFWAVLVGLAAGDSSIANKEFGLMDYTDFWSNSGPEVRGQCEVADAEGSLMVECGMHSGTFMISIDRAATSIKVDMKGFTMDCEELYPAKSHLNSYLTPEAKINLDIKYLTIENVNLTDQSLVCPLAMIGTSNTQNLKLDYLKGELKPVHSRGIYGVRRLFVKNIDKTITTVPYEFMAQFELLETVTLTGGSFVLPESTEYSVPFVFSPVTRLEISMGGLKALPKHAFKNTPNLGMLLLFSNKIQSVDIDAFEGLNNLTSLSMSSNKLSILPEGVFRSTPSLYRVDLYDNVFTQLSEGVFKGLTELATVYLFNNKVQLNLQNKTFANLKSLNELKLASNSITTLPGDLLSNSTSLRTLDLSQNLLEHLPIELFFGLKLTTIYLNSNNLTEIDKRQFLGLSSLENLTLNNNLIENLEVGVFADLINLKLLDLRNNNIEVLLNSIFLRMNNLKKLLLDNNRIKILASDVFDVISGLEVLSLSNNNITISREVNTYVVVESSYFGGGGPDYYQYRSHLRSLKGLRALKLDGNNVSIVCADWQELYHLEELVLSRNNFTSLSVSDTYFPTNVRVDFSNNKITTIDPYVYTDNNINDKTKNEDRPTLILERNPFHCDCLLYKFLYKYKNNASTPILQLNGATCASPPTLEQLKVTDLSPNDVTCPLSCPLGCQSCVKRPSNKTFELICDDVPRTIPNFTEHYASYKIKLSKFQNGRSLLSLPSAVSYMDLSNLNLTVAPIASSVTLNLTDNKLKTLPVHLLEKNCSIYMKGNPIECSCENKIDITKSIAYKTSIRDYRELKCTDEKWLGSVNADELCYKRNIIVSVSSISIILLFIATISVLIYRKRTYLLILVKIYFPKIVKVNDRNEHKTKDIFVSYAPEDEMYVQNEVLRNLENEKTGLQLCISSRDWRVGGLVVDQIMESINSSTMTLAIVSKSYLKTTSCLMEFEQALMKSCLFMVAMDGVDLNSDEIPPKMKIYMKSKYCAQQSHAKLWEKVQEVTYKKSKVHQLYKKPVGIDTHINGDGFIVNNALLNTV